ncbi:hypothetical protein E2C01_014647 [Portunus trituberculatus]|uniref:Uncharacterized protein n=1 Tax=Portunus trituberculatus TaxID=210409 RepID=A0A5B7DL36_PORTR|nr:hypothetical protein [Portunus trituberculatus]
MPAQSERITSQAPVSPSVIQYHSDTCFSSRYISRDRWKHKNRRDRSSDASSSSSLTVLPTPCNLDAFWHPEVRQALPPQHSPDRCQFHTKELLSASGQASAARQDIYSMKYTALNLRGEGQPKAKRKKKKKRLT